MEATSNPGPGRSASGGVSTNRAQETADEVGRVAKEKAGGVKAEVRERVDDVKHDVRERVEEKKHVATEKVHALARALRAAGETLEEEGESGLARIGRQAADQVERLASYIDGNDTSGMMRQFESMARDNPAAFTGTTFAAGIALGRFLRASRPDDTRGSRSWQERGASYGSGEDLSDEMDDFGSPFTGGIGFGGTTEPHLAGGRTSDIGPTTGGMEMGDERRPGHGEGPDTVQRAGFGDRDATREGRTYEEPGSARTGGDRDVERESEPGFETRGTSFGSGAGHATTGGGSTAGRSGTGSDADRAERDRQRSRDWSEGGSTDG